jgi:cyanophycinase-like exopeptidase
VPVFRLALPARIGDHDVVPLPRILVVLGSGETSPTMVTPHQQVFARLGPKVPAVCLDTPYGFQENADELTERVRTFFDTSVGRAVAPVRFRSQSAAEADPVAHAGQMARLLAARWIFAGPGSPSYALRQWSGSAVPAALHARLAPDGEGGAVIFASAAALTLGLVTVPVYEVYKVGEYPRWLDGLDVLGRATGLKAALVPHFDNTEGGTHDTRFCYLGERRLRMLEEQLPDGAFVLGVDEHTGLVLDLDTGQGQVVGRGSLTVRAGGRSWATAAGTTVTLDQLAELGGADRAVGPACTASKSFEAVPTAAGVDAALAGGDVAAAVEVLLRLEASAHGAGRDAGTGTADREALRAAVARLGDYAADAPVDRVAQVGPYVELLLELRAAARADHRYADADAVRDRLDALGVEVRDTAAGAEWGLR